MATKRTPKAKKEVVLENNQELAQEENLQTENGLIVAEVTPAPEAPKKLGIGKYIIDVILADPARKNEDILKEVVEKFQSKTTYACIAWYRTSLRKQGKLGPRHTAKDAALAAA